MPNQGERLKKIRENLGITQEQLANKLGIKKQSISKAEKNINRLSNESLCHLLSDFNIDINYLLSGEGEMFISNKILPDELASATKSEQDKDFFELAVKARKGNKQAIKELLAMLKGMEMMIK